MIGRAAERQRQAQGGQPRQEHVELPGIFGGEQPREPTVGGVVDAQPRLHAGEIVAAGAERLQGAAQLVRLRPVLGVVDHREGAARERQRDVERFRLGARAWRRHRDHRDRDAVVAGGDRGARFAIVGLDRDDHVEFFGRIIEPLDRRQQSVDRRGFAVERGDDGIDRQRIVGQAGRWIARGRIDEGAGQPQAEPGQEHRRQHHFEGKRGRGRRHDGGRERQQSERSRPERYCVRQRGGAAESIGHVCLSCVRRARGERLAGIAQHETVETLGAGEAKAPRAGRIVLDQAQDPARRGAARGDHQIKLVIDRERQHAGGGGFDQALVVERAHAPRRCRRAARMPRRARRQARADRFPRSVGRRRSERGRRRRRAQRLCARRRRSRRRRAANGRSRFPGKRPAWPAPLSANSAVRGIDRGTAGKFAKQMPSSGRWPLRPELQTPCPTPPVHFSAGC